MDILDLQSISNEDAVRTLFSGFYEKYSIMLEYNNGLEPVRFNEETAEAFFSRLENGFNVVPNVILGTFENTNHSIKRDVDAISKMESIPLCVAELLKNSSLENFYDDTEVPDVQTQDVSEKEILYINSLNSAQENIIRAVEHEDTVVIQGPPGTGKSQTICDIIVTEASKGHSVLVVTEKQAALDVIKSRLGNISDYVMMLPDAQNKEMFYEQLSKAIAPAQ